MSSTIASQFGSFAEQCGSDHVCATVVDAVLMLLLFIGLAIVCDDYLCPAIEELCTRMKVPDEAAGASFLAFGDIAIAIASWGGSSCFFSANEPPVSSARLEIRSFLPSFPRGV